MLGPQRGPVRLFRWFPVRWLLWLLPLLLAGCDWAAWMGDHDGDGYAACPGGLGSSDGKTARELECDCNDGDPEINPDAEEQCDGIDNDCSGVSSDDLDGIDDGPLYQEMWLDTDGDGHGAEGSNARRCNTLLEGYAYTADDCDDTSRDIFPQRPGAVRRRRQQL